MLWQSRLGLKRYKSMKVRPNLLAMKWVYGFLMLLPPTLGVAQMDEKVKAAYQQYRQLAQVLEDTTLSVEKRDSVMRIATPIYSIIQRDREIRDSVSYIGVRMRQESRSILAMLQSDKTLSMARRDSLTRLSAYLEARGEEIEGSGYMYLDKSEALGRNSALLEKGINLASKSVKELISIAENLQVSYIDRIAAVKKLAASRHSEGLDFLIKNLDTLLYAGPSDPDMYGRLAYYYTYGPDYICFTILMESKPDWSFLPAIEAALKERIVKDYRANLYGHLLDEITKGCKKCRDELLIWYRDYSDQNREDGKRLRTNAIRIIGYFANPHRLD